MNSVSSDYQAPVKYKNVDYGFIHAKSTGRSPSICVAIVVSEIWTSIICSHDNVPLFFFYKVQKINT